MPAIASKCAWLVPQHPPKILTPSSYNNLIFNANSSGDVNFSSLELSNSSSSKSEALACKPKID